MKLSKRLSKIATFINEDDIVADIGCDHAQLCCYIVLHNHCKKAYACDINEMPLQAARKNIEFYQLEDSIQTILCDGLDGIGDDVNTIVIAGMGYDTVKHILDSNMNLLNDKKLIIQINKDAYKLRSFISSHNFTILNEAVVYEDKHYYEIICFNTNYSANLNDKEIMFGKCMETNEEYYNYLEDKKNTIKNILLKIQPSNERYAYHKNIYNMIEQILNEYKPS